MPGPPSSPPPSPSPASSARIVPAAGHDLAGLTALAEGIFGERDRVPGWFRRKLAREAVDPALSSLVFGTGEDPIGYMLVGAGDEATGEAHGAGLGLLPAWRGAGVGPRLVDATCERLRDAGISALRLLADPRHRAFYTRQSFAEIAEQHTLGAPGTGPADLDFTAHPPRPWPLPGATVAAWSAGTWERTPPTQAATLALTAAVHAHCSREGRAVLVHRLAVAAPHDLEGALRRLRGRFRRTTPILLYGCDPVSPITAAARADAWQVVQRAHVMQRRFW